MPEDCNKAFGRMITRLIQKENLSRQETETAFTILLNNAVTPMQQGAFLAALTAKGETVSEMAGAFQAVFELDTVLEPVCLQRSDGAVTSVEIRRDDIGVFSASRIEMHCGDSCECGSCLFDLLLVSIRRASNVPTDPVHHRLMLE